MYEWNDDKNDKNRTARGLDFADAAQVFEGPTFTFEDTRFDYDERRLITFGLLEGRMVVVTHTPRGKKTRIISMRKANDREQKSYQERLKAARQDDG